MILADLPWFPLPAGIARRLAAWGFVLRSQAAALRDIDPSSDSIYQLSEANWEWKAILDEWEVGLRPCSSSSDFLGLPRAVLVRALLRQINDRLLISYRFFRLISRLRPGQYRLVLAAPRSLRLSFAAQGLPLNEALSSALWFVCKCALAPHALAKLAQRTTSTLLDGLRSSRKSTTWPILWLGLGAPELNPAPGELNALDFVRGRRLPLFREGLPIYVATPWKTATEHVPDIEAFLCPDPIRAMSVGLHLRDVLSLMKDSLVAALRILRDAFRHDGLFLPLAREYADLPRMRSWFPKVRPRAVLMTNSMYSSHPLWVAYAAQHQCDVVMLFYATNVIPLYFVGARDSVPGDLGYRLLECARFEVWNEAQKQWLMSLGIPEERVNVAGIIVWGRDDALTTPRDKQAGRATRVCRVGVFDVIPPNPAYFLQFGIGDNYYSIERMSALLADVVEVASRLPGPQIEIVVKPKRARLAIHAEGYFELLDALVREGKIKVGALPANPIDAVAACDMVISAPFSSPSVIAAEMKIPSCFYDPVGLLREPPGSVPVTPLITGRDQLRHWMLQQRSTPP